MAEPLLIEERTGFGLATVMARKGVDGSRIGTVLDMTPPEGPRWTARNGLALIGTGPGSWLAMADDAPPDWAERLRASLDTLASVSDQSGGYVVLRLAGEGARTLLRRGAAIDFHPRAFAGGSVAVTMIAHIGVVIRQLDEQPRYEIALFRSFAGSFRHWLETTAAAL